MKEPNFEFYVVNYDFNKRKCEMFNIFRNIHVYDYCLKAVKKYLRKGMDYAEFREEVLKTIQWQEWSRVEYECSVGDPFPKTVEELQKIDCFWQAVPNIDIICMMLITRYKEWKREVGCN